MFTEARQILQLRLLPRLRHPRATDHQLPPDDQFLKEQAATSQVLVCLFFDTLNLRDTVGVGL